MSFTGERRSGGVADVNGAGGGRLGFYWTTGALGFCSNFYLASQFDSAIGLQFATAEHHFQWLKAREFRPELADEIRLAPSAQRAKELAGPYGILQLSSADRAHWDGVKVGRMAVVLEAKFKNIELRRQLQATAPNVLEEWSAADSYWGTGSKHAGGTGTNWLGRLLVIERDGPQV